MAALLTRYRFTVDDYYRMAEAGILSEDDRVELIEGVVVMMAPINPPHGGTVDETAELLRARCGDRAYLRIQGPLRLDGFSEPVPDILLLQRRPGGYRDRHPTPDDVLLLVEVADTTLRYDRNVKAPLYASHGVPEVWLVNIRGQVVEVYRDPSPEGYRDVQRYGRGSTLHVQALPDVTLTVDEILG